MLNSIKIQFQRILPKQLLTIMAGKLADKQLGWLTQIIIKVFIRYYKVNMQEALHTQPDSYKTFNDFFARSLSNDARPIVEGDEVLALPADGSISQMGDIEENKILQAKGHHYTLDALLACQYPLVDQFSHGLFATIYLSPRDYHRVHMPCDGTLREMIYVPGELYSVNPVTAENIPNLFARNERLITIFDTPFGPMAQILVGATIVGSIETTWTGAVNASREGILHRWTYPATGDNAIILKKGAEMGCFKLGSTVINLFAKNAIRFNPTLSAKTTTHMGECFGYQFDYTPNQTGKQNSADSENHTENDTQ